MEEGATPSAWPHLLRVLIRPLPAFLGLSLLWGSEWLLDASVPQQPRLQSLAIQYGMAAVCLLPWAIRRRFWRRELRSIANLVISGLGILCLPQLLIFVSGRPLAPSSSLLALGLVPLFLALSGRLSIPIAVCGFAGVLFLSYRTLTFSIGQSPWLLLPLFAAAVLAYALAAAEKVPKTISLAGVLFPQCVLSALLLLIASQMLEREPVTWSVMATVYFGLHSVLSVVCGYLLFYWLLGKTGAGAVSLLQWTQPLVVVTESAALLRVWPQWAEFAGAGLIIIAIALAFSNRERGRGVFLEITHP